MEWMVWVLSILLTVGLWLTIRYVMKVRGWHWTPTSAAILLMAVAISALGQENKWHSVWLFGSAFVILAVDWYRRRAV